MEHIRCFLLSISDVRCWSFTRSSAVSKGTRTAPTEKIYLPSPIINHMLNMGFGVRCRNCQRLRLLLLGKRVSNGSLVSRILQRNNANFVGSFHQRYRIYEFYWLRWNYRKNFGCEILDSIRQSQLHDLCYTFRATGVVRSNTGNGVSFYDHRIRFDCEWNANVY